MNPLIVNHVNRHFNKLFITAVITTVNQLPPPWKPHPLGRRGHDPRTVAVCCLLKEGFNLTYDGIEAYLHDSDDLHHQYDTLPGHSVIHRGMTQLSLSYIRRVMHRVIRSLRRRKMTIAVDSTGFRTQNSSLWYDIRIGRHNTRKDCIKLHISVDIDTGIIHGFTLSSWKRHDSREFSRLVTHLPRLGCVLGDKALSSRRNCQLVADKKGVPYLHFRDNATGTAKGHPAWRISFRAYHQDTGAWLAVYHLRSIVESVFSSIKKRWRSYLVSRKPWMQKKELALKVVTYNVKQVLLVRYAMERGAPLWIPVS